MGRLADTLHAELVMTRLFEHMRSAVAGERSFTLPPPSQSANRRYAAVDLPSLLRYGRRCFSGPRAHFAELTFAARRWISARSCGACERSSTLPAPGRRANLRFAKVDLGSLLRKWSLRKIVRPQYGRFDQSGYSTKHTAVTVAVLAALLLIGIGTSVAAGSAEEPIPAAVSAEVEGASASAEESWEAAAGSGERRGPIETVSDLPRRSRVALFGAQGEREEGNYAEAAKVLEGFLQENPDYDHYLVRFHLGNSLMQTDRLEDALEHYKAAMGLEPRFMQGWLNLGELAYNLGHYLLAAESILKGYELNPDRPTNLLYHAASAYVMADKPELAKSTLEELVSGTHGEPKLEWYRALITTCLQLEDGPRGRAAVDSMLARYPSDPDAWDFSHQYYAATGDFRGAAVALTVLSYLRPLSRDERMQLGNLFSAIEVPYTASVYYESAIGDSGSVADFEMLASAYLAAHDTEAALETLKRAIEEQPSARLWSLLGDLYYMEEDYRASMDAFRMCTELDENHARAYLMMGYCALEMGELPAAVEQFELAANFPDQEEKARRLLDRVKYMQQ